MKKNILLLVLFTVTVFAQKPPVSGEVSIDGKAKASIAPDIVTFTLYVSKVNKAESEALKQLNTELDELQNFLSKSGIPLKQVKIRNFSVSSAIGKKAAEKVYIASASLSAKMQLDYKQVEAVYLELQTGKYKDVSVNYSTSLSDELESKTRETLVQQAIADAKLKAESIAKPLGVKITGVKSVSKNGRNVNYNEAADNLVYNSASFETVPQTVFTKFEVLEKELDEHITIVFEIGKG